MVCSMKNNTKIAITSRSLSSNKILRKELESKYTNIKFNDEGILMQGDSLLNFLQGANKIIIGLEKIDRPLLEKLPELNLISKMGVGLDNIDLEALNDFDVKLSTTPGTNKRSVSELFLLLALNLLRNIKTHSQNLEKGIFKQIQGNQLSGKTVGLIGFGNVGKEIATLLSTFGCKILAFDINQPLESDFNNVEFCSFDELVSSADVISLHLPLNNATKHIINSDVLSKFKKDAILINTARGGLVDEFALKNALVSNQIKAAGFDVFENEPNIDPELLKLTNFIATPHIGGSTKESTFAMGMAAIKGLEN